LGSAYTRDAKTVGDGFDRDLCIDDIIFVLILVFALLNGVDARLFRQELYLKWKISFFVMSQ
jgi:hypothetical protein